MSVNDKKSLKPKKNRELTMTISLAIFICFLIWFEFRIFSFSEKLPLNQSIFFFGLVNFNLILLLLLGFFILKNLFKVFVNRYSKWFGDSLKSRLIATFLAFSFIPTTLMFIVALIYINSSLDRWFSEKMQSTLKNALTIQNEYYSQSKKKNFKSAFLLNKKMKKMMSRGKRKIKILSTLREFRKSHGLDSVEFYPSFIKESFNSVRMKDSDVISESETQTHWSNGGGNKSRWISLTSDMTIPKSPLVPQEILQKVFKKNMGKSYVQTVGSGNWIRVMVPSPSGVLVISSFIPNSIISKMSDVSLAYEEIRERDILHYPLKSIYIIVLVLTTLMILFCSIWFGIHIARNLSLALETLGEATHNVAKGNYQKVKLDSGEKEVLALAENFNSMVEALGRSYEENLEVNNSLKLTLQELNQKRQYMHVVLSNVNTGVLSLDSQERITVINEKAAQLLQVKPEDCLNQVASQILNQKYYSFYKSLVSKMEKHNLQTTQMEVVLERKGQSIPSLIKVSTLHTHSGQNWGRVVVFDDLTDIIQKQKAVAWKEVARRIAHEVKNPLTPIKLSAQRLQKKFGTQIEDPAFTDCINMIVEQTDSLKHLISEFNDFARFPDTKLSLSDLNGTTRKVISFYQQAHKGIEFISDLDDDIENFYFDSEQIKRALFNLVENAVHATSQTQGARIQFKTSIDHQRNIATLKIMDNGQNMSPDDMRYMFEPYYSKKSGGSGLGLTIVKKIIEDHKGYIKLETNEVEKRGLDVEIELPYKRV